MSTPAFPDPRTTGNGVWVVKARSFAQTAQGLLENGYAPIPIRPGEKAPAVSGWNTFTPDDWLIGVEKHPPVSWLQSHPNCGVGIRLGINDVWCLDVDVYDKVAAEMAREHIASQIGTPMLLRHGNAPKFAVLFRTDAKDSRLATRRFKTGDKESVVEALGSGRQLVVFGIHPDTNQPYKWIGPNPLDVSAEELPFISIEKLQLLLNELDGLLAKDFEPQGSGRDEDHGRTPSLLGPEADPQLIASALQCIPNDDAGLDYDEWVRIGIAIKAALGEEGQELFEVFSQRCERHIPDKTLNVWESLNPRGDIGAGTIFALAERGGWNRQQVLAQLALQDAPLNNEAPARKGSKANRLRLIWADDITEVPDPDYLVKGLLERDKLATIYGPSNCGKTFFALDLAMHIAEGRKWRGLRTKQGLVVYIVAEGVTGLGKRLMAYKTEIAGAPAAKIPLALCPTAVNFMEEGTVMEFVQLVRDAERERGQGAALVVVDTLARNMAGGDENTQKDAGAVLGNADRLRQELGGATVLFIHHTGKDISKGMRGSTAIIGAVDTTLEIIGDTGTRIARDPKQRDYAKGSTYPFELKVVDLGLDSEGDPITSCVVGPITYAPHLPRLKPRPLQALHALKGILQLSGIPAPDSMRNALGEFALADFGGREVISLDEWRAEFCRREIISESHNPDEAKRKAFSRARTELVKIGAVLHRDNMCGVSFDWRED